MGKAQESFIHCLISYIATQCSSWPLASKMSVLPLLEDKTLVLYTKA